MLCKNYCEIFSFFGALFCKRLNKSSHRDSGFVLSVELLKIIRVFNH